MAQKKRLSPNKKAELKGDLAGLKGISTYSPARDEFKTAAIEAVETELDNLDDQIDALEAQITELKNRSADKGELFAAKIKGARQQIIAQFGDDSPEYEAVGGTRLSNRSSGLKRGTGGVTATT